MWREDVDLNQIRAILAETPEQEDKQSLEWLATSMVSWFSQRITVGESEWARTFERTKINGLWAYESVALGNG